MRRHFIFFMLLVTLTSAKAQRPIAVYNHLQYFVHDLAETVAFYKFFFGLDTIPCPFPPNPALLTKWLRLGDNLELHISQTVPDTATFTNQFHLGFKVPSIDAFVDRLMKEDNDYRTGKYTRPGIDKMPYGAKTTMIKDPSGIRIHLIEGH
jgi:catechol 2,3-dioxygenase-like lactoylglutathione lyase family enzyme